VIRPAAHKDLPDLVALGEQFFDFANVHYTFDRSYCENFLRNMIASTDTARIFVMERDGDVVGMIGGLLAPMFFNGAEQSASEMFWWVAENYRGHPDSKGLFKAFEQWAKSKNATTVTMTALEVNPKIGELYERRGYAKQETNYVKKLAGKGN
jgi:GNAT superfamily N-acetyltransferase